MTRRKISLITAVWGEWHTETFLQLNLKSLLSRHNLPALATLHSVSLIIFTTAGDRTRIERSPTFRELADVLPVEFEHIADYEVRDPIATQQRVWSKAIEDVNRLGTYLFFLPPDVIWSDASMQHIGAAMAAGRTIVIIPWSVRVVSETFRPAITSYFEGLSENVGIGSRELVRMTLEHLHPLVASYKRDSPMFPHHPEMLVETVKGQGLLLRLLASIPTVYEPRSVSLNNNKLVVAAFPDDEVYVPCDSDDVFVASLAPFGKDSHFYDRPRRADPVTIGRWWLGYPSGLNDLLVRTNYRIHYNELDRTAWRAAERGFDYFLRRSVIAREGLHVWHAVRKRADCSIAVEAIAGALHTGTLARAIRGRGHRLVLLPNNRAVEEKLGDKLDFYASKRRRLAFIRLLRSNIAHLTPKAMLLLSGGNGIVSLQTDDGGRIELRREVDGDLYINKAKVSEAPLVAGEHVVLITPFVALPSAHGRAHVNPFPEEFGAVGRLG